MARQKREFPTRDNLAKGAAGDTTTISTLAADKLEGVEAIARFLGSEWTAQRVYNARRSKALPIRKVAGIGIYAFRSEIEDALRAPETLISTPTNEADEFLPVLIRATPV